MAPRVPAKPLISINGIWPKAEFRSVLVNEDEPTRSPAVL